MGCKVIAFAMQKGGVGKTTSVINLGAAFAAAGKKILIIDFDPQGNASTSLGIRAKDRKYTIYDVLVTRCTVDNAIYDTVIPNLKIITADMNLAVMDVEFVNKRDKERALSDGFHDIKEEFDYILIDCPPSLGLLTINALYAASSVIITVQAEFLALEGLVHLMKIIELIRKKLHHSILVEGILLTMMDKRNKLSDLIEEEVRGRFGEVVYKNYIPRNVAIPESSSNGIPVLLYDNACKGSKAYILLAKEILDQKQ